MINFVELCEKVFISEGSIGNKVDEQQLYSTIYNLLKQKLGNTPIPEDITRFGVTPDLNGLALLMMKVAHKESRFYNAAQGDQGHFSKPAEGGGAIPGGSHGLFQLSPVDAQTYNFLGFKGNGDVIAGTNGIKAFSLDQLHDPYFNADLTTSIWADSIKKHGSVANRITQGYGWIRGDQMNALSQYSGDNLQASGTSGIAPGSVSATSGAGASAGSPVLNQPAPASPLVNWIRGNSNAPLSTLIGGKFEAGAGKPTPEELKLLQRLHNSPYNPGSSVDRRNLSILRQAGKDVGGYQDIKKLAPAVYSIQYAGTPKGAAFKRQAGKTSTPNAGNLALGIPEPQASSSPVTSSGSLTWGSALTGGSPGQHSGELQKGGNPIIYPFWDALKEKYPSIVSYGIWGNEEHQRRKSDHNTGDAIDVGIKNLNDGENIFKDVIASNENSPFAGYIKYVIHNRQIWSPEKGLRRYTGKDPHTSHVHVSFNRA